MFGAKKVDPSKPFDPADDCPIWQSPCRKHNCRWWVTINGTNPNTGVHENKGDCAMAWLPFLVIENAQMARQAGASTDKVASEVKKFHDGMARQNAETQRLLESKPGWEGDK